MMSDYLDMKGHFDSFLKKHIYKIFMYLNCIRRLIWITKKCHFGLFLRSAMDNVSSGLKAMMWFFGSLIQMVTKDITYNFYDNR